MTIGQFKLPPTTKPVGLFQVKLFDEFNNLVSHGNFTGEFMATPNQFEVATISRDAAVISSSVILTVNFITKNSLSNGDQLEVFISNEL
jgi:hypothetical protein